MKQYLPNASPEKRTAFIPIYDCPGQKEWNRLLRPEKEAESGSITMNRAESRFEKIDEAVGAILREIRNEGDAALLRYVRQFDFPATEIRELRICRRELLEAERQISVPLKEAIETAFRNISAFHAAQSIPDITVETVPGVICYQKSVPIEKIGLYIPGGTAPLFSTVLMLGIPARLAGCKQIILCTPAGKDGNVAPEILYAASRCGIEEIYKIGGAAAIAAMAYGTGSIPPVCKIFGPGNDYVTRAKQRVAADTCAIDLPAGPSEVMILADDTADPQFICADLISQMEHGSNSRAVLATVSRKLAEAVSEEFAVQAGCFRRREYILDSAGNSCILILRNEDELIDAANLYAPEHLIICTENYMDLAGRITNAGSIFLGSHTPESAGDYASGTNHTLPTGGWAASCSGVNLSSFIKRITWQRITPEGLERLGPAIETMARAEGLDAHRNAVSIRLRKRNLQ